jgi:hypothetical protein
MKRIFAAGLLSVFMLCGTRAQEAPKAEPTDSVYDAYDAHGVVKPFYKLDHNSLEESSGLDYWQGAWWTHNDSGDGPYLYRGTEPSFQGSRRLEVPLATAVDWEEITTLGDDLLVCDIGDNRRERDDLMLYRVSWDAKAANIKLAAKYEIAYPDGKHDAEAAADIGGVLHIVSKNRGDGFTAVYKFPDLKEGEKNVGELVGKLEIDERTMITAADYDPEAKKLLLLSYTRIFVYGDKLEGKPERSVLIYAEQCESLCIHEKALFYGNEQRDVFRVNNFLASKYEHLLPERRQAELPVQEAEAVVDGTGQAWKDGAFDLKLNNLREGEFLRWKVCGAYLMVAGSLEYDSFTSSNEKGPRLGTAMVLMFGSESTDFLAGDEKLFWLGDNGESGVDAWLLNPRDFGLSVVSGVKKSGEVKSKKWTFEYALPLTAIFGEGKLPESFLLNAWGYNLHGEGEPHIRGNNIYVLSNPYMWGGVEVKLPKKD